MILALCSLLLVHAVSVLSVEQPQNSIDRRDFNPICSSYIVSEGDSCTSIAAKCDITTGLLTTYNKGVDCAKNVGKPMCCSTGGTPVPPRDVEGVCYKYTIRGEDTCERIAKAYGITIANIEAWNKETWAWYGCGDLQIGGNICLTEKGVRPMPVSIPGAVCGPQVPGTARPTEWKKLPSLNPCPSSQCCNRKGQCGTGADFCGSTTSKASATTVIKKQAHVEPAGKTISSYTTVRYTATISLNSATSANSAKSASTTITTSSSSIKSASTILTTRAGTTSTGIETVPSGWTLLMYMEKGCEGDYVTLQGHNKELRNSKCLVLHGGLSTNITDEDVSCRYWVDGGLNWKSCDDSPKTRPASWKMINGLCTVVDNDKCDNYNSIGQTYGWRGKGGPCQNGGRRGDPKTFNSMQCYVG